LARISDRNQSLRHRLASLGNTKKKNVLSILEKIGRAQIRKARNIFLWCPPSPRGGGGASSFVGVFRKMGSDFFKQTPPNPKTRHMAGFRVWCMRLKK
ncbi:MAG: hypothetical protein Q7R65_03410, partial [bacterium]|nr:hypothetical protein [bacterium]